MLKRASGGGDFLDLKALAEARTLVVFKIRQFQADETMTNGIVNPVLVDVLICSGPQAGEVHPGERVIGRGITGTLRRGTSEGDDVAARMELLGKGAVQYAAAQTPSDPEFDAIAAVYRDGAGFQNAMAGATNGATDIKAPF